VMFGTFWLVFAGTDSAVLAASSTNPRKGRSPCDWILVPPADRHTRKKPERYDSRCHSSSHATRRLSAGTGAAPRMRPHCYCPR
jgi:hypothetical protein